MKVVDFKKGLFALTPQAGGRISETAISAAVARSGFTLASIVAPPAPKRSKPAISSPTLLKKRLADAESDQVHSLALFASGKFDEAGKAAHAALLRGKHWNWKTLGGHYKKTADHTSQLRALENSIRQKSTPEKRFLVAYHYLMLGQPKAARAQFQRVARARPDDKLVASLRLD